MAQKEKYHSLQPETLPWVRASFNKISVDYGESAEVMEILSSRLLERLDPLALKPSMVLDVGCGAGSRLAGLKRRFRGAQVVGLDASEGMLGQARARASRWRQPLLAQSDAARLPIPDNCADLVIASQLLPWCQSPLRVLREMYRVLTPGGAIFWSSAGPDTLQEYRLLWNHIDTFEHCFGLIDMHDLGDDMLAAGFDAPVLDRENLSISYPSLPALVAELRAVGAANIARGRRRGLMASSIPGRLQEALVLSSVDSSAKTPISVTLELVQGHGWKSQRAKELAAQKNSASGEVSISLEFLRNKLKRR